MRLGINFSNKYCFEGVGVYTWRRLDRSTARYIYKAKNRKRYTWRSTLLNNPWICVLYIYGYVHIYLILLSSGRHYVHNLLYVHVQLKVNLGFNNCVINENVVQHLNPLKICDSHEYN
jgi:hypothetical protein